jgi:hypothetical protein
VAANRGDTIGYSELETLAMCTVSGERSCDALYKIPHSRGLQGHSDADVGMHTVTDAIYGAKSWRHRPVFRQVDPHWKALPADIFMHACDLLREMAC